MNRVMRRTLIEGGYPLGALLAAAQALPQAIKDAAPAPETRHGEPIRPKAGECPGTPEHGCGKRISLNKAYCLACATERGQS